MQYVYVRGTICISLNVVRASSSSMQIGVEFGCLCRADGGVGRIWTLFTPKLVAVLTVAQSALDLFLSSLSPAFCIFFPRFTNRITFVDELFNVAVRNCREGLRPRVLVDCTLVSV